MLSLHHAFAPSDRSDVRVRGASMEGLDRVIARAKKGDEDAFRELFHRHRETVARIVQRFMGPSADLEDVIQDVFIHVHRSIGRFRGDAKFSTWLYRLTANVTKMHLRKGRSRPRIADVAVPESREDQPPAETPDAAMARDRRVRALHRLLQQLSDKKREVLVMHDLEGLPAREIAEIVDAPTLTVRTRLFYARKELYAALAEEPALREVMDQLMDDLPGKPRAEKAPARPAPASDQAGGRKRR